MIRIPRSVKAARRGPESGAAAVELALVSPLFIALIFGIFNLGWALHCGAEVRHAVERSTRMLIANPATTSEQLEAAVHGLLHGADPEQVTVTLAEEDVGAAQVARISWTYRYTMSTPFIPDKVFNFDASMVVPLPPT